MAQKLDTGCDRFAKWRWQTLAKVSHDLLRMEAAVRAAVASIKSADALKTCDDKVGVFLATAKDSAFWDRLRWVQQVLAPLRVSLLGPEVATVVRSSACRSKRSAAGGKDAGPGNWASVW